MQHSPIRSQREISTGPASRVGARANQALSSGRREMPLQVFLACPVLVEQEGRGVVEGSVHVVVDAAGFGTSGSKQVDELLLNALLAAALGLNLRDYCHLFPGHLRPSSKAIV